MIVKDSIRRRFLRDNPEVRLGGIAANLARIHSFSDNIEHGDAVESLINESRYFIEWTAPYLTNIEQQSDLLDLQRVLTRWLRHWSQIWPNDEQRHEVAKIAQQWSDQMLDMSGLAV